MVKTLMRQNIMTKSVLCLCVFFTGMYGSGAALSAVKNPGDDILSVRARTNPAFDPQGIRLGDFIASPSFTTGIGYTDNVYASNRNEVSDMIYTLNPSMGIKSDFVRHAFNASVSAQRRIYKKTSSENYTDYKAAMSGRVDITGQTAMPIALSYARDHLRREDPEDFFTQEPVLFDLWTATTGLIHRGRGVVMKAIAGLQQYVYDNGTDSAGGIIRNDERDRKEWTLYSSIGLPEEGYFAPYVYSNLSKIEYERETGAGLSRNSQGYEVGVGTIINFSDVTQASFNVGYINRDVEDSAFEDVSDFAYGVNLVWEPSTLAAFILEGKRTVEETVVSAAPAAIRSDVALSMDYELFPNMFLKPSIGYQIRDYEGLDRKIEQARGGVGVTYKMNQNLWLSGNYTYITQDETGSSPDPRDFESNNFNLSLKLQF